MLSIDHDLVVVGSCSRACFDRFLHHQNSVQRNLRLRTAASHASVEARVVEPPMHGIWPIDQSLSIVTEAAAGTLQCC